MQGAGYAERRYGIGEEYKLQNAQEFSLFFQLNVYLTLPIGARRGIGQGRAAISVPFPYALELIENAC